jgi:hypothetical protein
MERWIGDFNNNCIRLIVIADSRDVAWRELLSAGAKIVSCTGSMGKMNCQGDIFSASLIDIEKLERDGWKWLGMD